MCKQLTITGSAQNQQQAIVHRRFEKRKKEKATLVGVIMGTSAP
jgi:hypothetical protein